MQPQITFDKKLRETYGDGKYFVYRSVGSGQYLPYDETSTDIYVDTNPVIGKNNNYLYKFVTGARETPLYGPVTVYVPVPPTPLPTCAFYLNDYSHVAISNNSVAYINDIIEGKYTYRRSSTGNTLIQNVNDRASILHVPYTKRWYVLSRVTGMTTLNNYTGARALYLGASDNRGSSYKKRYSSGHLWVTLSQWYIYYNNRGRISTYRFYWNSSRTGGHYWYRVWRWTRYQYYKVTVTIHDNLADIDGIYYRGVENTSATMYVTSDKDYTDGNPPDTWSQGYWWRINILPGPQITCFRPTPTPTAPPPEPPPTPTPTAYPITPTPTAEPLPSFYFMTEWSEPILTETDDYLVRE